MVALTNSKRSSCDSTNSERSAAASSPERTPFPALPVPPGLGFEEASLPVEGRQQSREEQWQSSIWGAVGAAVSTLDAQLEAKLEETWLRGSQAMEKLASRQEETTSRLLRELEATQQRQEHMHAENSQLWDCLRGLTERVASIEASAVGWSHSSQSWMEQPSMSLPEVPAFPFPPYAMDVNGSQPAYPAVPISSKPQSPTNGTSVSLAQALQGVCEPPSPSDAAPATAATVGAKIRLASLLA